MFWWICGADTIVEDEGDSPHLPETIEVIEATNFKDDSASTIVQQRHVVVFSRNFRIDEKDYLTMEEVLRDQWLFMESNGYYCETTLDATRSIVKTTKPMLSKETRSNEEIVDKSCIDEIDSRNCEYRINALSMFPFVTAMPQSVLKLDALETLNLSDNILIEHLPPWIGNLKNLKHLNLSFTKRLRKLPEEIGQLTQLLSLSLVDSGLVVLPNSLHMLKSLQSLELRGCEELLVIPSSIGYLTSLKEIDLFSATKLQRLPEEIGRLRKLNKLDLSYSNILYLPFSLGKLKSLEELDLCFTKNLVTIPEGVSKLKKLHRLNLSYSNISSLPDSIGRMKQLQCLNLHQCRKLKRLPESVRRLESAAAYKGSTTNMKQSSWYFSAYHSDNRRNNGKDWSRSPRSFRQQYLCAYE